MAAVLDETRVRVKVTGDFACFTRPDLKVERMSYPCMTASAARGVLDCLLWKPQFKWYVRRILVLNPVLFFSIKRNEINAKQGTSPLYIEKRRTQRTSIILKNVGYIIEASVYQDAFDPHNPPPKYVEMFRRRVRKGQCFRRPYLGTREFACEFMEAQEQDVPINDTIPIGSMFHDMLYADDGTAQPLFASDMAIRQGVLHCQEANNAHGNLNSLLMTSRHLRPPLQDGVQEMLQFYAHAEEKEAAHAQ